MSNLTSFPDAIVFPDSTIRLVTAAAKRWAHCNTQVRERCAVSEVPDYVAFMDEIPKLMEKANLVLKRERQPAFHYRSKRKKAPKGKTPDCAADDFDKHRARFQRLTLEEYRKRARTRTALARPRRRRTDKRVGKDSGANSKCE